MVVAAEVKHAVDRRLDEVARCARGRSRRRPARAGPATSPGAVDRERQDVRGLVEAPMLAVELGDALRRRPARPRGGRRSTPAAASAASVASRSSRRDVGEVGQLAAVLPRLPCSSYAATIRWTSWWRTTSSPPKRMNEMSLTSSRMSETTMRPGALVARQVDLGDVAGHDHLRAESEPRRGTSSSARGWCSAPRRGSRRSR